MTKKKFKAGDRLKIVAGKCIGRTAEHRRDSDKGECMGCVLLAGDNCERKLFKTSMMKSAAAAGCNVQRKKSMPGDKLKVVAGKCIGRMGECRMDTDTGDSMCWVMLIGDMCNKCIRKTSVGKLSDQGASKEMAILGMHLSGMSVEEVMHAAQWRSPSKFDRFEGHDKDCLLHRQNW
jgi:hypothetical protein